MAAPAPEPELRIVGRDAWVAAGADAAVSYLDDGRQVIWQPPTQRAAVDAERCDRAPRAALVGRHGFPAEPEAFATAWTVAEVQAKLLDVPILEWLRTRPAPPAGLRMQTRLLADERVVVTVGWLTTE